MKKPKPQPSKRQGQFLAEYQRRALACEPPPTFRELAKLFRLASTNSVNCVIAALITKGYLRKFGGLNASRSIILTDLGRKWKAPSSSETSSVANNGETATGANNEVTNA